ncbi:MAG: hypothetical protein GY776_18945 [Alteromonas sp.]|nr:hypothetical protein [Alteromonas sp.]
MDQPHMLAYINPAEELMLRKMGGAGIPGPDGIPVYGFYENVTGTKFEDSDLGKALGVTAGSGLGSGGNLDRAYNSIHNAITGGGAGDNPSGVTPKTLTSVQQSNANIAAANRARAKAAAEATAKAEAEKSFLEKMSDDFKSLIGLDFGVNQQALRDRTERTLERNALDQAYYGGNDDANLRQGTYGGSGGFMRDAIDLGIANGAISPVGSSTTASTNSVQSATPITSGTPSGNIQYADNVVVPSGTGFVGQMYSGVNPNNETQYTFEELSEMFKNRNTPTSLFG